MVWFSDKNVLGSEVREVVIWFIKKIVAEAIIRMFLS